MESLHGLKECERVIQAGSSTFYQAFQFLPSPRREAVYVIYAFCRMIDDAVDEPEKSAFTLEELEAGLTELEAASGHFIWPALRWLFSRFPVEKGPFYRQMEGQKRDYVKTQYATLSELEEYCYLVAGTVGEMLLPVLHGSPDERIVEAGIYLGKAMQIVNIIRDVGEDAARGRRYLPLERMQSFGYSEEDFAKGLVNLTFRDMLESLMETAEGWLQRGLLHLETYDTAGAFCIELAARGYMAILDEVRSNRYQVYTKRAIVSKASKLAILRDVLKRYPDMKAELRNSAVS